MQYGNPFQSAAPNTKLKLDSEPFMPQPQVEFKTNQNSFNQAINSQSMRALHQMGYPNPGRGFLPP